MTNEVVYNPFAYEIHEDPYPTYKRLRDEAPAYYNAQHDFWALSRYQDLYEAMHDWQTYSNLGGVALEKGSGMAPPMIIAMDPPRQTKLRKIISSAFTPRRIAMLEPKVRELTRKYLAPLVHRGEFDFIQDFAARLPMDVISTMMGVPEADQDMLRGWADALLHREEGNPEVPKEGIEGATNLVRYFATDIRKRRGNLGDDLISALITIESDGEKLSDDEIYGFCFLLVIAGNETTTKMLGNVLLQLHRHRDQRDQVVADPRRAADAVEEIVRFDNSTQMLARVLTRDVEMHGRRMQAGKKLLLLLGAGNRDERVFDNPDKFDINRKPQQHLGFGFGTHVCLGAALARLEGRVALEEIHAVIHDYEVDEAGMERVHSTNVRGYSRMPIRFRAG